MAPPATLLVVWVQCVVLRLVHVSVLWQAHGAAATGVEDRCSTWNQGLAGGIPPWSGFATMPRVDTAIDRPRAVASADLNGDGFMDVIGASNGHNTISWWENNGAGQFHRAPQPITSSAIGVRSVFAADVNGDDFVDVLSASTTDDTVRWFKNDGSGNFTTMPAISTTADGANSVFAADLNGDGFVDVLSSSANDDSIRWYRNDGLGNFTAMPVIFASADGASSVFAADLTGDGLVDVISASFQDSSVRWFKNLGAGTFALQPTLSNTSLGATSVFAADLDGDGLVDVVCSSQTDSTLGWFRNDGFGGFSALRTIATVTDPASVFACDISNNGALDLVVGQSSAGVLWYRNDGHANFTSMPVVSTTATGVLSVFCSDLDGDGKMDLLSADLQQDRISWYRNELQSQFVRQEPPLGTGLTSFRSLVAADLDGNGHVDIVSASSDANSVNWFSNNGGGNFTAMPPLSTPLSPFSVFAAPLTSSGRLDVLSASYGDNRVLWYSNNGQGNFTEEHPILDEAGAGPVSVFAGDLDGDGLVDVIASLVAGQIRWWRNEGSGNFTAQPNIRSGSVPIYSVILADLDGDGHLDVACSLWTATGNILWFRNDGAGHFTQQQIIRPPTITWVFSITSADLNGDGHLDLLSSSWGNGHVTWFRNDGQGAFSLMPPISTTARGTFYVASADINSDGHVDVISTAFNSGEITWYRNDGQGNFTQMPSVCSLSAGPLVLADLDSDGKLDLVSGLGGSHALYWYRNTAVTKSISIALEDWMTLTASNSSGLAVGGSEWSALPPVPHPAALQPRYTRVINITAPAGGSSSVVTLHKQWTVSVVPVASYPLVVNLPPDGLTIYCCVPANQHCVFIVSSVTMLTAHALRLRACPAPVAVVSSYPRGVLLALVNQASLLVRRRRFAHREQRPLTVPPVGIRPPLVASAPAGPVLEVLYTSTAQPHPSAVLVSGTALLDVQDPGTPDGKPLVVVGHRHGAGAAVEAQHSPFLVLRRWLVYNCTTTAPDTAGQFGAVAVWNSTVWLQNCSLHRNVAESGNGGAIVVQGTNSELQLHNVALSSNTAPLGCGGAVYIASSVVREQTMQGTHLEFNTAATGGALCMARATRVKATSSEWRHNQASSGGGAVSAAVQSSFTAEQCAFTQNTAKIRGGAVSSLGSVLVNHSTISEHRSALGGALFCDGCAMTALNSHFTRNEAEQGGVVYGSFPAIEWTNSTATANLALQGGAIWCRGPASSVSTRVSLHGGRMADNRAGQGGGLWSANCGVLLDSGAVISNNTAASSPPHIRAQNVLPAEVASPSGLGGGLFVTGRVLSTGNFSVLACTNASVSGNVAALHGGGLALYGHGVVDLRTCAVVDNTALGRGGGAFFLNRVPLVHGTTFVNNTAPQDTVSAQMGGAPAALVSTVPLQTQPQHSGQPMSNGVELQLQDLLGQLVGFDSTSTVRLAAASGASGCITATTEQQPVHGTVSVGASAMQLWGQPNSSCAFQWSADVSGWQPAAVDSPSFVIPHTSLDVTFAFCSIGQLWVDTASSCSNCTSGRFMNETDHALTLCYPCKAGTFQTERGQAVCPSCALGEYSPLTALTTCFRCQPGKYSAARGQSVCTDCAPGTSSGAVAARVACEECTRGRYQGQPGQPTCFACPGAANSTACVDCPAGTRVAITNGTQHCEPCAVGSYSVAANSQLCLPAGKGSFVPRAGLSAPLQCQPGNFSDTDNASSCTPCPAGRFAPSAGLTRCFSCNPGTFANEAGLSACVECPVDFAQSSAGAVECTPCLPPSYTDENASRSCSFCSRNFFFAAETHSCQPCPVGTNCVDGNLTVLANYCTVWNPQRGVLESFDCLPGLCAAGGQCQPGRKPFQNNPLCAECLDGYSQWRDQCVPCDGIRWRVVAPAILGTLVFVLILLKTSQSSSGAMSSFMYFVQNAYLFLERESVFAAWFGVFNLDASDSAGSQCVFAIQQHERMLLGLVVPTLSFAFLFLLTATHWALSRSLWKSESPSEDDAPPVLPRVYSPATMALPSEKAAKFRKSQSPFSRVFRWSVYLRTLVAMYIFSFSAVTTTVFEILNCQDLPGDQRRVRAFPAVDCDSAEWARLQPWLYALMAVFCFAIPLAMLATLYRVKTLYGDEGLRVPHGVRAVLGVIYEPYRPSAYFWGLYGLFRRAILVCSWVFLMGNRSTQLAVTSICNLIFFGLQLMVLPFGSLRGNTMQTVALLALCLITNLLHMTSEPFTEEQNILLGVLTIGVGAVLGLDVVYHKGMRCLDRFRRGSREQPKSPRKWAPPDVELVNLPMTSSTNEQHATEVPLATDDDM